MEREWCWPAGAGSQANLGSIDMPLSNGVKHWQHANVPGVNLGGFACCLLLGIDEG